MKYDIPIFRRCCFCVPLRIGLLVWSYFFLIILGLNIVPVFQKDEFVYYPKHFITYSTYYTIKVTSISILIFGNMAFTILFIVAAHKKSSKLMKDYNKCAFIAAIVGFIILLLYIPYEYLYYGKHFFYWEMHSKGLFSGIIVLGMQTYILLLVRSEIMKLDKKLEFELNAKEQEAGNEEGKPIAVMVDNEKIEKIDI
ncbi:hypothetical protein NE865_01752 [Phthorimaea operculella]|nr:hypothetical protein NE865_01752 [Phthorimaea operculella]